MINIFINPLGKNITIDVIDTSTRTFVENVSLPKTGNDFEIVPEVFVELVKKHTPRELWCVTGPGPFTLMRIITLILNSISYNNREIYLKGCHYFDLIDIPGTTPIFEANRHEFLIRDERHHDIIIPKESLPLGEYRGYIDESGVPGYTPYIPDIDSIMRVFENKETRAYLSPLYIKPPNITIGSKKTSLPSS